MNKDNAVAAPAARLFAAVFASCSVLFFPATALAQSADDIRDGKVCATCHADAPLIWGGKHGTKADSRTPMAIVGCATCHGDPSEHLKSGSPMPQRFSKMSAAEKNGVCQTCHQGRERMHWPGSAHERNDVSCSSCFACGASFNDGSSLASRGASVLLSNSASPEIERLYGRDSPAHHAGLEARRVPARRAINSQGASRGPVDEYLITNVSGGPIAADGRLR